MKSLWVFILSMNFLTVFLVGTAQTQNREATLAAVMKLPAAERQARLVEGAKKESGLVWYSSTTAEDALALTKKFHEQHPSIQIQHLRSSSEKLLERILAESRANAFKADIVSLPELELSIMIKRKLLARYLGVENSLYPAESKDPRGYWTGLYTSAWVPAHNTKMVGKEAAPKTYKDLLNPKWKGAIAMDNEPYNWYVVSLRYLENRDGKEAAADFMKKLAAQQMQWRKGHSLIGQLMAAGEFPIAAELQVHTVERAKAQGAPVEWSVLDGVIPISKVGAGITSTGANIYTSALFYDFLLSRPGMETIRASRRIPTRPDVTAPYLKPYKLLPFDQQIMDDFDKYVTMFRETFKPAQ
ncbi:MAG TPA: extracellular solute-binding protein [Candidatus Binatia bacterium]|nr:extracellular solute-binding protein [Candidatus Binatia bacterium]